MSPPRSLVLMILLLPSTAAFANDAFSPSLLPARYEPSAILQPFGPDDPAVMRRRRLRTAGIALLAAGGAVTVASALSGAILALERLGCGFNTSPAGCTDAQFHQLGVEQNLVLGVGIGSGLAIVATGAVLAIMGRRREAIVLSRFSVGAAPVVDAGRTDGATASLTFRF
jgi:hypothetical protein